MNTIEHNIFIVPIEPLEARYSRQWFESIPTQICMRGDIDGSTVRTFAGEESTPEPSLGGFLDFATTNSYKASQIREISHFFVNNYVKPGDVFLVTDAWNPVITALRYTSDLLGIPVEIHGIWHAGAYDPTDILGMKMQKPWPWHQERAYFHACDYNYFATNFHANMFKTNLEIPEEFHHKIIVCGQPHEKLVTDIVQHITYNTVPRHQIVFPHRINADKQPQIAEDLEHEMTNINWYFTQKQVPVPNKHNFYDSLALSKIMFSCSLHENLGISMMEGCLFDCIPVLPNRASYAEMYLPEFLYPSEWTSSWENYLVHRQDLIRFINHRVELYEDYLPLLEQQKTILKDKYLNANVMYDKLLKRS